MKTLRVGMSKFGGMFRKQSRDEELNAELASHVELETEANIRAGMPEAEARRQALIHSGGVESAKEEYRDRRGLRWIDSVMQDVRYAVRTFRKSPLFLAIALVTLALGIGANTAMFSLMRKVMTPFDVAEPSRVVFIWTENLKRDWHNFPVSIPDYLDWKASGLFSKLAPVTDDGVSLRIADRTDRGAAFLTTGDYFDVAGIQPLRGRWLRESDSKPGAELVVVIREELWRSHFGSRDDIAGSSAVIDGKPRTIVGVMPKRFPRLTHELLYSPIVLTTALTTERGSRSYGVLGRLAPGVTIAAAQKRMDEISARLAGQFKEDVGNTARVQNAQEGLVQDSVSLLTILSAAVGLVLLVACANLASLLLARGAARGKEIALRSALGAGRFRIARQLLTESLLLALGGGLVGMIPAVWGLKFVRSFPMEDLDLADVSIDWTAVVFAVLLSLGTGIIFGLAPAIHAWRADVNEVLKSSTTSVARGGFLARLRGVFVGTEVAVAMVLLVAAGLLLQSLLRLEGENPGYNPHGILSMRIALAGDAYEKPEQRLRFFENALAKVTAVPGVEAAAAAEELPTSNDIHGSPILFPDRPEPRVEDIQIVLRIPASADYFTTMQQAIVRGRGFTSQDREGAPAVVVVDEYTAAHYWPGQNPMGKQIWLGSKKQKLLEVVGVVKNQEQPMLLRVLKGRLGVVFMPMAQWPKAAMSLVVRAAGGGNDAAALAGPIRSAIRELDPDQPVFQVEPLEELRKAGRAPQRLAATLLDGFAVLAVLLAAIGIYGVIAWHVAQRTREFGIRLSLGAEPGTILRLAIRQGLVLAGLGIAIGLVGALVLTRFLVSLLHGVAATDPMTFVGVTLLFLAIAVVASWLPARQAARIDPSSALRA